MTGNNIGRMIRAMREAGGMSPERLAAKLGTSSRQVRGFEDGKGLTVNSLIQMARALGVPLSAFMDRTDSHASSLLEDEVMLLELYRGLRNHELKSGFIGLLRIMHNLGAD